MRKLLPIIFFLALFALLLNSCRKASYADNPVLALADSLMQTHPDSALQLLETLPEPEKMNKANQAWHALLLTQARYKNYVLLEGDSLIQVAVDYYKSSTDKEKLAKSYFYTGCAHHEQEDNSAAIDFYLKSLRAMPQGCDSMFLSMIYGHLGDCYSNQSLEETAREMYNSAYAISLSTNDTLRIFNNLKSIGSTFFLASQLDSAFHYFHQALEVALPYNQPELTGAIYQNLAGVYNEYGEYEKADEYISKALIYLSDEKGLSSAYSLKGDILHSLGKSDSALYYWSFENEDADIYTKASNRYSLYQANKELSRWKDAVFCVDSFLVLYDSIQTMSDKAEIDRLMDNHLLELHKYKLSAQHNRIVSLIVIASLSIVLLLVSLFVWRDINRKNKYIALQKQLMDNRAETMLLDEKSISEENRSKELHKLKEERTDICIALFKATEGYGKLDELIKSRPKERIHIIPNCRKQIIQDVRATFVYVMEDMKLNFPSLTADDLLYCILALLHCPKEVTLYVMNATSDALKTRKSRIKTKMPIELFETFFNDDDA